MPADKYIRPWCVRHRQWCDTAFRVACYEIQRRDGCPHGMIRMYVGEKPKVRKPGRPRKPKPRKPRKVVEMPLLDGKVHDAMQEIV